MAIGIKYYIIKFSKYNFFHIFIALRHLLLDFICTCILIYNLLKILTMNYYCNLCKMKIIFQSSFDLYKKIFSYYYE